MIDYNALANTYDEQYKSTMCIRENKAIEEILTRYNVSERKVLDVGCGTGFALDVCKIRKYKGIDISKEMIEKARIKYPDKNFIVTDIKEADLGFEMFDCALFLFSIPYVGTEVAEKIYKSLERGGLCICVYYNKPYLNPQSVYYKRKAEYKEDVEPKVKEVITAFNELFRTVEERKLTKDGTYTVSVFVKDGTSIFREE